ncbi:unnamed protein product [Gongylonema pulchrum]|uniref:SERPIN domain-containing protein n=1 Tax=Gongylonema pulchrum TaxID=637853 RepID=A0A183E530_9BILA|nr:unnamed protein product [Gongylonema pulchrum]
MHANFSLRLLSNALGDEQNQHALVLSPLSLATTISLASATSGGITKAQMNDVLAKGFGDGTIQDYYLSLKNASTLESNGTAVVPSTLMVLHVCNENGVNNALLDILNSYMVDVQQFDCNNQTATVSFINDWVMNRTKSESELFTRNVYSTDWRLVLIDTFYFNAVWQHQFDLGRTMLKQFYCDENTAKEFINDWVMNRTKSGSELFTRNVYSTDWRLVLIDTFYFNAAWQHQFDFGRTMLKQFYCDENTAKEDADVQVLGLPYREDSGLYLYILLPRVRFGLNKVEREMTGRRLFYLFARSKVVDVEVEIPKFSIENHFELNLPLASLGIVEAFTSRAEFPAISIQRIHVSMIIHKTQFEVINFV